MEQLGGGQEPAHQRLTWPQIACASLLAIAGMGSAWCGYQTSLWASRMSLQYAAASGQRVEATRHMTRGGQERLFDALCFLMWAQAESAPDRRAFLEKRFRPEFKTAFDAWLATGPLENPDAPTSPMAMSSYHVAMEEVGEKLVAAADHAAGEGNFANDKSDRYARGTIFFTLSLVLAGSAQVFARRRLQWAVVAMSGAMTMIGFYATIGLPAMRLI